MSSSFVGKGLEEFKAGVDRFAEDQAVAHRAVDLAAAKRILARERSLLLTQTSGQGNTAAAMEIREYPETHTVVVAFGTIRDRPSRLPIWIEFGTIHQPARPFARPAIDAERARVTKEHEKASIDAAKKSLGD